MAPKPEAVPTPALALIRQFEGFHKLRSDGRADAYPDPIHGWDVPTIGYGTTRYPDGGKVKKGDIITRAQGEEFLLHFLETICRPALQKIPSWKKMNLNQRAALYSFAYNLGPNFYQAKNRESITRLCDSPIRWDEREWVMAQFVKYRNPGSAAEKGLLRRRTAEAELFLTPV